jgi:hypothetical protein
MQRVVDHARRRTVRKLFCLMLVFTSSWCCAENVPGQAVQKIIPPAPLITSTPLQTKYDRVVSVCNVVTTAGSPDEERFNWVVPSNILITALGNSFDPNSDSNWNHIKSAQVVLLSGPQHGTLTQSEKYPNDYKYRANAGYTGMDQMTFEVKLDGKTYKGIYSVYVASGDPAIYNGCTEKGPNAPEYEGSMMEIPQDGAVDAEALARKTCRRD